jgi:hypothetical protein
MKQEYPIESYMIGAVLASPMIIGIFVDGLLPKAQEILKKMCSDPVFVPNMNAAYEALGHTDSLSVDIPKIMLENLDFTFEGEFFCLEFKDIPIINSSLDKLMRAYEYGTETTTPRWFFRSYFSQVGAIFKDVWDKSVIELPEQVEF